MTITTAKARRGTLIVSTPRCAHEGHETSDACRYRVAWSINPHMKVGAVDAWRAVRQHGAFVRLLARLGAHVARVPFVHGAYDSIFAKDNAVLVHRGERSEALIARPLHPVRRAEQDARAHALGALGFAIVPGPDEPLEGGDVVMLPGGRGALLGHGFRSSARARPALACFLDAPVIAVELVDPRLYHLDMAVAVLGDGTALVCEEALAPGSREAIARAPGVARIVRVPLREALRFGVNVVEVGRSLVMGGDAPRTARALRSLGWATHALPLDQFHLGGGSAACLVARVHVTRPRHPRVARSATAAIRSTAA
jgi:N-dimethylarginine dimethylaminohydrolase